MRNKYSILLGVLFVLSSLAFAEAENSSNPNFAGTNAIVENYEALSPANAPIPVPTITVSNPSSASAVQLKPYSRYFSASGGTALYSYATSSTLPTGLSLTSGGLLHGTPTETGTFPIEVTATDALGASGTGSSYGLVISAGTIGSARWVNNTSGTRPATVTVNCITYNTVATTYTTIQSAINAAASGDVVYITDGTYANGSINANCITGGSSAYNYLIISSKTNLIVTSETGSYCNSSAIITGYGFRIRYGGNITIQGLKLENVPVNAFYNSNAGTHTNNVTIKNNWVLNTYGHGIKTDDHPSDGVIDRSIWEITGNKFENIGSYNPGTCGLGSYSGIWLAQAGYNFNIIDNIITNTRWAGILCVGQGRKFDVTTTEIATISGNRIDQTVDAGIQVGWPNNGYSAYYPKGANIRNNTITNANSSEKVGIGGITILQSNIYGVNISYNDVSSSFNGLAIEICGWEDSPDNTSVTNNNFYNLTAGSYGVTHIAGIAPNGLYSSGDDLNKYDFTNNYWGAATGPTYATNPTGTGVGLKKDANVLGGGTYSLNDYLFTPFQTSAVTVNSVVDCASSTSPCIVCPTIGSVSASESTVCINTSFNITATGLTDMDGASNGEQDFGIKFVAFASTPADPYIGGTSLGTVPFASLTTTNTAAELTDASLATNGSYEIYAILSPSPTEGACRPFSMTTISVEDNIAPVASCQNITVFLDGSGNASITASDLDGGSTDNCSALAFSASQTTFTCANIGANNVTLTVTDGSGNTSTCSSTITVADTVSPTASCQNITVFLDGAGTASIVAADIDNGSTDNCSTVTLAASQTTFTCANLGANNVTLTATDGSGNTSTCASTVTVADSTSPTASCQNITVFLDGAGTVSIVAADIDNGSTDNCSTVTLAASQTTFTCANLGANSVTLTATDGSGNTSTCASTVTVADSTSPTASCQNITVFLDGAGTASIVAADIDNGSTDNCSTVTLAASQTTYTCANLGANIVTLTATDGSGNTSTCASTVTVADTTSPTASCQNITVFLDGAGTASIVAADIDNGSTDNCSTVTLAASQTTFTCANLGANNVTLTATDGSGNTSTCTSTVTVADTTSPTAVCQNINTYLDGAGNVTIVAADIDGGSSDNCGVPALSASQTAFTCANIGANNVTLTAIDGNSNVSTCSAVVTVLDTISPVITCPGNQTESPDGSCNFTLPDYTGLVTASDNCNPSPTVTQSPVAGTVISGNTTITMTSDDGNGNTSACTFDVTLNDATNPTAVCQNINVYLDGTGNVTIVAADIDNGSTDNCGAPTLSASQTAFTCANIGANNVTLTATDGSSNTASCVAVVTVVDTTSPTAVCQYINAYLDGAGNVTIVAADIDGGSSDNCGSVTLSASPTSFTCANLGANNVTLTANDGKGNTSTCVGVVTVIDTISPVAICNAITVEFDANGTYTLTTADITNIGLGSSDNCSIASMSVFPNTFECTDAGSNSVILTVTDDSNNSSTCIATVTIGGEFTAGAIEISGETICYNGDPTEIGSDTDASGSGTITFKWESSIDGFATDGALISGANLVTYDPPTGLQVSTSYRRYAHDACDSEFVQSTGTYLVTVNGDFTAGAIATDGEIICYEGDPVEIGSITAASGGDGNITYQWQSSTDASFTSPSNISTDAATYNPSNLTATTWFRRQAKDATCNTTFTSSSGVWKVTVSDEFIAGSISDDQMICDAGIPEELIGVAPTGGSTPYQYQWQISTDDINFLDISGATGLNYQPEEITETTYFRLKQTSSSSCGEETTNTVEAHIHHLCCSDGTNACQGPNIGANSAYISDVTSGQQVFDNYTGIVGAITHIEWWGSTVDENGDYCDASPKNFVISFYKDNEGTVGDLLKTYEISVTGSPAGANLANDVPIIVYNYQLSPLFTTPIDGWVSIQGDPGSSCEFTWVTSPNGDGLSYIEGGNQKNQSAEDFAFGLTYTPDVPLSDWGIYLGALLMALFLMVGVLRKPF